MDIVDHLFSLQVKFFTGDEIARNWMFLVLMNVCAAGYLWLCSRMRAAGAARRGAFPYFVLFATTESWLVGLLFAPSQFSVWTAGFVLLAAPLILLVCSLVLTSMPDKSSYDWIALITGFAYPAVLLFLFTTGILRIQN
jgi:hypothetical protein